MPDEDQNFGGFYFLILEFDDVTCIHTEVYSHSGVFNLVVREIYFKEVKKFSFIISCKQINNELTKRKV